MREQLLREQQLRQQAQAQLPQAAGLGQGPTNVTELERHLLAQQYGVQVVVLPVLAKAWCMHMGDCGCMHLTLD